MEVLEVEVANIEDDINNIENDLDDIEDDVSQNTNEIFGKYQIYTDLRYSHLVVLSLQQNTEGRSTINQSVSVNQYRFLNNLGML